jgi:holo-[acyl-carrier protein] synthase
MPDEQEHRGPSGLTGLPGWIAGEGLSLHDTLDGAVQCGVDVIEIDRIKTAVERWGQRFVDRVWTPREQVICRGRFPELAARFAGKEAASKALGTGISGLVWREIEILRDSSGKPLLFLHGAARERAEQVGFTAMSISLSHSHTMACALVVGLIA